MTRTLSILSLIALTAWTQPVRSAATGDIYTWTDSAGVIHFSDTLPTSRPPAPGDDPVVLDEDTPVPATLNELLGADESAPATVQPVDGSAPASLTPGNADATESDLATSPVPYQPGSGNLPLVTPGDTTGEPVPPGGPIDDRAIEALDALDPVWFRGPPPDAEDAPDVYMDEYGPFTIGGPLEDQRAPPAERCRAARRDLEVLRDTWPVYRDQGGRLRFQWDRDPYRGARHYLDDPARAAASARVRETLRRDCEQPDDPGAQSVARDELMQGALCEAERAELAAMESLGSDNPTQKLSDKRALAAQVCGQPAPAQG